MLTLLILRNESFWYPLEIKTTFAQKNNSCHKVETKKNYQTKNYQTGDVPPMEMYRDTANHRESLMPFPHGETSAGHFTSGNHGISCICAIHLLSLPHTAPQLVQSADAFPAPTLFVYLAVL